MGRAKKTEHSQEQNPAKAGGDGCDAAEAAQNNAAENRNGSPDANNHLRDADATLTLVSTQGGTAPKPVPDMLQEGIIDGRYQILSILGKGGMGTVFLAKHLVLNRIRAVKVLHPHLCSDGNAVIRFRNEAAAVSALEHANIIAVHDSGTNEEGIPYIAMDFVEGTPLSEIIRNEGAIAVDRALPIFRQVAEALSHAHEKGIVHRDLKPSNIIIVNSPDRKDFVRVVDFGIAKILPQENVDAQKLTQTGDVFGSPLYMSPEQCMGGKLDERSDIYSLGCLMYETLTGKPPFQGNTSYETFLRHMNDEIPNLKGSIKDRSTRESLEVILYSALAKQPEKRYQTMRRLSDHLQLVEDGLHRGILARVQNWWYLKQLKRGPQRKVIPFGRFVAALTVALFVTVFGVFFFIDLGRQEPQDYYQTLLWSNAIAPPKVVVPDPIQLRKLERAKQLCLIMINLPGGADSAQQNTLDIARKLRNYGQFHEAALFYQTYLEALLRETKGQKRYYMASTYHDYAESLLYSNDLNGAERAYRDEIEILNDVYEDSPALFMPLLKVAAIHAKQKMWTEVCQNYAWINNLHGKLPRDIKLEGEAFHEGLQPMDLCRFGEANIQSIQETKSEADITARYKLAREEFAKAFDLLKSSGSSTGNDYYAALVGIARCAVFFGKKQEAIDLFGKAVKKVAEDSSGNIPVAVVYTNFADFCFAQGDYWDWLVWRTKVAIHRFFHLAEK